MASRSTESPVGVVTVSFRSASVLAGFLDSLPGATVRPRAVIVADNLPEGDAEVEALTARAAGRYLPLPENPGYGAAINAAVKLLPAEIEWVLVSNPDVAMKPGSIDRLLATGEADDRAGAVGPRIVGSDGAPYPSARSVPSLRTGVGHALFSRIAPQNRWTRAYYDGSATTTERRDAGWLSGACLLVRRSAFDRLGGFDERYFMYFEDVDLGYRLGKAGFANVFEPAAVVIHTGAHSTSQSTRAMVRAHHDSARRFVDLKYSAGWMLPIRGVIRLGLGARSWLTTRRLPS